VLSARPCHPFFCVSGSCHAIDSANLMADSSERMQASTSHALASANPGYNEAMEQPRNHHHRRLKKSSGLRENGGRLQIFILDGICPICRGKIHAAISVIPLALINKTDEVELV
jgi:hypothetical protein